MLLVDFCNIMSGTVVSSKERDKSGKGIPFLQASDIRDDGTISEPEYSIPEFDGKPNRILTLQDVLLISRGKENRAVTVDQYSVGMVASNSFLIIRVLGSVKAGSGKALPSYVAWYLNSWEGQQKLEQIRRGSNILYISKKNLQELDIPLPDYKTQENIAAVRKLLGKELDILNDIAEKRQNLIESRLLDQLKKSAR